MVAAANSPTPMRLIAAPTIMNGFRTSNRSEAKPAIKSAIALAIQNQFPSWFDRASL